MNIFAILNEAIAGKKIKKSRPIRNFLIRNFKWGTARIMNEKFKISNGAEKQIEITKKIIETIIEKLAVDAEIEILEGSDCPQFVIRTQEAGILIGENGQHLVALSHLIKKMAEKETERAGLERILFFLDVNDYQAKKIEELKNLARVAAQRVRYFKKEIALEPMNAYERKIVHSTLTEYPDIETESAGEEPNRKITIKPFV